jgi:uncharacterized protein (TIGR00369 family)
LVAPDPAYAARVRASFERQGAMRLIGARLTELRTGHCAIELPYRADLTQQHGYIHAGIVSAIADTAGGYAGFSLFSADASVLTVEYKLNLLAPAAGERLIAVATWSCRAARWRSPAARSTPRGRAAHAVRDHAADLDRHGRKPDQ